jgi:hypothetical protein
VADTPSQEGFELELEVYHFLRRCPDHPNDIPTPAEILLPLAPLRRILVEALARHREELRSLKRKAETWPGNTPTLPQTAVPPAAGSTIHDRLRAWKERKRTKHSS